jgi:DNA gyrase/topoisomerase IV subunit A
MVIKKLTTENDGLKTRIEELDMMLTTTNEQTDVIHAELNEKKKVLKQIRGILRKGARLAGERLNANKTESPCTCDVCQICRALLDINQAVKKKSA